MEPRKYLPVIASLIFGGVLIVAGIIITNRLQQDTVSPTDTGASGAAGCSLAATKSRVQADASSPWTIYLPVNMTEQPSIRVGAFQCKPEETAYCDTPATDAVISLKGAGFTGEETFVITSANDFKEIDLIEAGELWVTAYKSNYGGDLEPPADFNEDSADDACVSWAKVIVTETPEEPGQCGEFCGPNFDGSGGSRDCADDLTCAFIKGSTNQLCDEETVISEEEFPEESFACVSESDAQFVTEPSTCGANYKIITTATLNQQTQDSCEAVAEGQCGEACGENYDGNGGSRNCSSGLVCVFVDSLTSASCSTSQSISSQEFSQGAFRCMRQGLEATGACGTENISRISLSTYNTEVSNSCSVPSTPTQGSYTPRAATPTPRVLPRTGLKEDLFAVILGIVIILLGGVIFLKYRNLNGGE
jgi:LPXTG-motif cell wall-anchored protein